MRCATENQAASNQELVDQRLVNQSRSAGRSNQGAAGSTSEPTGESGTREVRAHGNVVGSRERLRSWIGWLWGREMFGTDRVAGRRSRSRDERPGGTRALALERCEAREVFAADLEWHSAWQNPAVSADVVPDGIVTPADVLRVVNALAADGELQLPGSPFDRWDAETGDPSQFEFLDVTGDGWLTGEDVAAALQVLEAINAATTLASYERSFAASASSDAAGGIGGVASAEWLGDQTLGGSPNDPWFTAEGAWEASSEGIAAAETANHAIASPPMPLDDVSTETVGGPSSIASDGAAVPPGGLGETLSISMTGTGTVPGGVFGDDGLFAGGEVIEIAAGVGAGGNAEAIEYVCVAVPATAGPVPSFILDLDGAVRAMNWRPAWTALDDAGNVGVYIDDFDSPYISPATWYTYTDDNNKIAPKIIDVGFRDDTHFAWLEAVGYRSYYVATHMETMANTTPVEDTVEWSETVSFTTGTSITNTVSIQIGAEFGAELEGIAAKVQAVTSGSIAVNEHLETTESRTLRITEKVPDCSVVGLYKLTLVTEVQWDYAMMYDTVLGPMYGYEREMGRFVATSKFDAGHRAMFARGLKVRVNPAPAPINPAPAPIAPAGGPFDML